MQAKQYLRKIKRLDSFAKTMNEELEELKARAESIGCLNLSKDKIQTSGNPDKLANDVIKLVMQKQKYEDALNALYEYKAEAEERIKGITNDDYRLILTMRYLRFNTFEEIAVEMQFTFQWICELHKRALIQFEELYFK